MSAPYLHKIEERFTVIVRMGLVEGFNADPKSLLPT